MDILWLLQDTTTSAPITGAYPTFFVRREFDGFLLNLAVSADSFTVSGASAAYYDEVDNVILPGLYKMTLDTDHWDDGVYNIISYYHHNNVYMNNISEFAIREGLQFDNIDYVNILNVMSSKITPIDDKTNTIKDKMISLDKKIAATPPGSVLTQEYYNNQDLDNNGLIYGIDFYIDIDRPKILDNIPRRGTPVSWQDYIESLPE